MTIRQYATFPNVTYTQLANLYMLLASKKNTDRVHMHIAYREETEEELYGGSNHATEHTFRHISVLWTEASEEIPGCFTVHAQINAHFEPINEEQTSENLHKILMLLQLLLCQQDG